MLTLVQQKSVLRPPEKYGQAWKYVQSTHGPIKYIEIHLGNKTTS